MNEKKQSRHRLHRTILKQMLTLATSGFGLVAALAWNNVIQEFVTTRIKPFLPQGSGLLSLSLFTRSSSPSWGSPSPTNSRASLKN